MLAYAHVCSRITYGRRFASGDTVGVFLDADKGEMSYFVNGVCQGVAFKPKQFQFLRSGQRTREWSFPYTHTRTLRACYTHTLRAERPTEARVVLPLYSYLKSLLYSYLKSLLYSYLKYLKSLLYAYLKSLLY
jgi:hypothetical protein